METKSLSRLGIAALLVAPWFVLGSRPRDETLQREVDALRQRVAALEAKRDVDVDRLIVRRELVVSDTGAPWEKGYEAQQIARGLYARPGDRGAAGVWVRSRLIKTELDDPFDDRFHALERSGKPRGVSGHISWNEWRADAWRQQAIVQGEAGHLRFQSFRPDHDEPLTDALLGQGMLSLGGGGFGGEGLRDPKEVLEIWGGSLRQHPVAPPGDIRVEGNDGSGRHTYAIVAVGPQGARSAPSATVAASGRAKLRWDQSPGADSYVIVRDGKPFAGPLRREGTMKRWEDRP